MKKMDEIATYHILSFLGLLFRNIDHCVTQPAKSNLRILLHKMLYETKKKQGPRLKGIDGFLAFLSFFYADSTTLFFIRITISQPSSSCESS